MKSKYANFRITEKQHERSADLIPWIAECRHGEETKITAVFRAALEMGLRELEREYEHAMDAALAVDSE